jgi:hypothetical protein
MYSPWQLAAHAAIGRRYTASEGSFQSDKCSITAIGPEKRFDIHRLFEHGNSQTRKIVGVNRLFRTVTASGSLCLVDLSMLSIG